MIYPEKLSSKKTKIILNIFAIFSVLLAIILIVINRLTTPNFPWAGIANCGILYVWVIIIFCIKRNTNIAGHVLLQVIATSALLLYIDKRLGFLGWSLTIAIPIVLMTANVTMFILTLVSYKKYIRYAIYQLIILILSFLPVILEIKGIIKFGILGNISVLVASINMLVTIILCIKDVIEAVRRKIHM